MYKGDAKKIGIIGGGQLGKMIIQAALDYNFQIFVLDPDINCPCAAIAHKFVQGDIQNIEDVYNFGKLVDLITIEIENVNTDALLKLELEGQKVFPQPNIIINIKNKATQKRFFVENNIPTAQFIEVANRSEILKNKDFLPAVNKICVGGYDGKGVEIIRTESEITNGFDEAGILEKLIDFEKELAVIVSRNSFGEVKCFPVVEMVFHPNHNLVEYLFSPAQIEPSIEQNAIEIAEKLANSYQIVGLLAVEMFLTKTGELMVNEVAPRPHNSGHHTQKANYISQYDQFIRAINDLPLGDTEIISKAAMVNILGEAEYSGEAVYEGLEEILTLKNVFPFFYNKKQTKPFRKMGHVTILEEDFEKLKEKVKFVQDNLKVISI